MHLRSAFAAFALLLAAAASVPAASPPEMFRRLDRDGDGKLTAEEAGSAPFFAPADANRDGVVTLAELEAYARSRRSGDSQGGASAANPNRTAGMEGDGAGPIGRRVAPVIISETASPILPLETTASDGQPVRAFWRRPQGAGPFPALVFIHGGLSRLKDQNLETQLRGNPVITRFLQRGYVVVQATFRTYDQEIQSRGPIEDVRAVVHALARESAVDRTRIALYGGSGGGSIALELGSDPQVRAVVAGEPATIIYTGMLTTGDYQPRLEMMANPAKFFTPELRGKTLAKLRNLRAPVLILHSDQHDLHKMNAPIFVPLMREAGVNVEYREYPGFGHGFYFGGGDDRWGKAANQTVVDAVVRDVREFLTREFGASPAP